MTEQELIAGCQRGERDAQRALYERTSERIYRLLLRMTRCPAAAEDLAQETYLKAFAAIATFEGRSSLDAWLYRIALNEALQAARRRPTLLLDPEHAARRPAKADDAQAAALRLDLESALAKLEPMDRAVLLLRHQEGLDYRAIAEVTQVAMGTVASRLNRARARLRALLADFSPDGEENAARPHPMRQDGTGGAVRQPVQDQTR